MLYVINQCTFLHTRKTDSQNVISVFCCVKNWRRQLIGSKGRSLRKSELSTMPSKCTYVYYVRTYAFMRIDPEFTNALGNNSALWSLAGIREPDTMTSGVEQKQTQL